MRSRRFLVIFVVSCCVLGLSEVGARILDPAVEETLVWRDHITQAKVEQMAALDRADVVFAGSSQMLFAVDPALVVSPDSRAYNAGIYAGTPMLNEDWLLHVVVPELEPSVVVYGLSAADLVDDSDRLTTALVRYHEAPARRDSALAAAERWLSTHSSLWRHRQGLRAPSQVLDAVNRRIDGRPAPVDPTVAPLSPLGFSRSLATTAHTIPADVRATFAEDVLVEYSVGPGQVAALERIIASLRDRGIEVVLAEMPISRDFASLFPGGTADLAAARRAIASIGERNSVSVLDLASNLDDPRYFADYDHLNGPGALVFGRALARVLGDPATLAARLSVAPPQPLVDFADLAAVPGIAPTETVLDDPFSTITSLPPATSPTTPPVTTPTIPPVTSPTLPPVTTPTIPPLTVPPAIPPELTTTSIALP